ncbi:hypothetical protein B0H13DRAFT_1857625 [Mycena leptocephala]|nr:hypothetical protein B0H13DRAFT_1857625 [Mycena leptocephala]
MACIGHQSYRLIGHPTTRAPLLKEYLGLSWFVLFLKAGTEHPPMQSGLESSKNRPLDPSNYIPPINGRAHKILNLGLAAGQRKLPRTRIGQFDSNHGYSRKNLQTYITSNIFPFTNRNSGNGVGGGTRCRKREKGPELITRCAPQGPAPPKCSEEYVEIIWREKPRLDRLEIRLFGCGNGGDQDACEPHRGCVVDNCCDDHDSEDQDHDFGAFGKWPSIISPGSATPFPRKQRARRFVPLTHPGGTNLNDKTNQYGKLLVGVMSTSRAQLKPKGATGPLPHGPATPTTLPGGAAIVETSGRFQVYRNENTIPECISTDTRDLGSVPRLEAGSVTPKELSPSRVAYAQELGARHKAK